jgi:hypothetical protein
VEQKIRKEYVYCSLKERSEGCALRNPAGEGISLATVEFRKGQNRMRLSLVGSDLVGASVRTSSVVPIAF